jgi:histidinol-phosphatase
MNSDWKNRYEVAVDAARKGGELALGYFDTGVTVEWKHDASPVTVADREAELLLRKELLAKFPGDAFLGEESGNQAGTTGYRWIIDPIDGTRNFVRGIPLWGTLVGLEYQGECIAGVAAAPALGLSYRALRGDGAYRGDRRLRVSEIGKLADAQVFYSTVGWFVRAGCQEAFLELSAKTQRQRGFGDFYGFVLVAQGSGEVMVEHGVHAWDVAAIKPIVEEAGGRFSNWDGGVDIHRPDILVTNGKLHEEVLAILPGLRDVRPVQNV